MVLFLSLALNEPALIVTAPRSWAVFFICSTMSLMLPLITIGEPVMSWLTSAATMVWLPFSVVVKENTPRLSVVPPSIVLSRYTLAPRTGWSFSSSTLPLILYCAFAITANSRSSGSIRKDFKNVVCMRVLMNVCIMAQNYIVG